MAPDTASHERLICVADTAVAVNDGAAGLGRTTVTPAVPEIPLPGALEAVMVPLCCAVRVTYE